MAQLVLYVDSNQGRDDRDGRSPGQPLKTLTAALRQSSGPMRVQLQSGNYTAESGETFPLVIPAGCTVQGTLVNNRPAVTVRGGGAFQHPLLGAQNVTCLVQDGATIQTLNVTNPYSQGVGLWMDQGRAVVERLIVSQCERYGAAILAQACPTVRNARFEACGQAGIAFFTQSKGQLERVYCQKNQVGLRLSDAAAPLLRAGSVDHNQTGIAIAGSAHPVLRQMRVRHNRQYGLHLTQQAGADLGHPHEEGGNLIRQNRVMDIQNDTGRSLISCGNDVLPQTLRGPIDLVASEVPDPSALPPMLFDQPASFPETEPESAAEPSPSPTPAESPIAGSQRFSDMTNHWAGPFVDRLAAAGVVAGFPDGTFKPNRPVTRAEFAAVVVASFPDQPVRKPLTRFTDIPTDFWGYDTLTQAHVKGFLSGFPDGTMRPNQTITRIQAIVAVANGLALSGGTVDDIGIYRDRAQVPSYAVDALAAATRRRLVVNYPEPLVLRPLETISRGEVAALIYQGRVAVGLSETLASPYIVRPDTTQPLFTDIQNHWASDFIRGLTTANLVSGMEDGRFAPDRSINRAQFATMLVKAFQPSPQRSPISFADVRPDFWAAAAIQAAYRGNFMAGFPDQTFGPDNALLRVQVWVALVNGLYGSDLQADLQPLGQFTDYTSIPRYALQSTAIALEKALITCDPNDPQLRPNQVATRADASAAVYQALVDQGRLPAIHSAHIATPRP